MAGCGGIRRLRAHEEARLTLARLLTPAARASSKRSACGLASQGHIMSRNLHVHDLLVLDEGPRIFDLKLAEALGFERPRKIRDLIERNLEELSRYGAICLADEVTGAPHDGAKSDGLSLRGDASGTEVTDIDDEMILPHGGAKSPRGRGRPSQAYLLNEDQALLVQHVLSHRDGG